MSLLLQDPRKFSNIYPDSNMLINQAQADLSANNENDLMVALVEDLLKREQDEFLSVAYNLAPTKEIADYIWSCLQLAINRKQVKLFVIPLVLVVGSSSKVTVNGKIDQNILHKLMLDKEIFADLENTFISGRLFTLEQIVKLKPSFLANSLDSIVDVQNWPLFQEAVIEIENLGESVYLRFLVGAASNLENQPYIPANFSKLGLELMQLVTEELKTENATIFPIPFPPCYFSEAAYLGERYRKEIHISLRLSNQVRKMRQAGQSPVVKLRTVDETIKVELWDSTGVKPVEIINWHLERGDDFNLVCSILQGLFADMQLTVIYE